MSKIKKGYKWFAPYSRLASRYIIFSLSAALLPIVVLSALYDNYFVELIEKVSEKKNIAQIVAYENTVRHFFKEREIELDNLKDQFDHQRFYDFDAPMDLAPELEGMLRVLSDTNDIYGIVFFDDQGEIAHMFPSNSPLAPYDQMQVETPLQNMEIYGPSFSDIGLPSWIIMKSYFDRSRSKRGVGLVIRFSSLTRFMDDFILSGFRQAYLQVSDGRYYDASGHFVRERPADQLEAVVELMPGWKMYIEDVSSQVIPPTQQVRYMLLLTTLFTVCVILYVHYSIGFKLNEQIDKLVKRVERVAQGDVNTPLKIAGSGEINKLSVAIESMRNQLQKFIRSNLEMERQASMGQMAAGIAHEVRNPLTTLNTAVQALRKQEKEAEKVELLEIMGDEISRTNTVIKGLLDYARPRDPEPSFISVRELLEHTKILADVVAKKYHSKIELKIEESPPEVLKLFGDSVHLRQILLNLVLNGLQAMEGKKNGTLRIIAKHVDNNCAITVFDEGCGIPDFAKDRILEPFFTTKSYGSGLGLAICASLVERNRGQMTIDSTVNFGTTITLLLPVYEWADYEFQTETLEHG
ncbi:MAG: HAMP domain-containing protein [Methylocystaceae bacterium]|nr:HAMP domain-containing protein [Methylocystaceae bacterium]